MPLKADEFVVLVATDPILVAFTTAFSWGSDLTVAAREKKRNEKIPFFMERGNREATYA